VVYTENRLKIDHHSFHEKGNPYHLEKSGYVERKNDPADGRAYNIELTQKGEEVHKEHHTFHLKLAEDINGLLEPEELNQLTAILKKINHSL
jgi:DNA-binding MarR family transcriptional regulator